MADIASITKTDDLTMSSREIAEICDARHNDVVETIMRLFGEGVLRESRKTTRIYKPEGGGRPTEVYDLTKRDTLVVVSGYNADVRAKIIDRWLELENTPSHPLKQQGECTVRDIWIEILKRGAIPGATGDWTTGEVRIPKNALVAEINRRAREDHNRRRAFSDTTIGVVLKKMIPGIATVRSGSNPRQYILPPLQEYLSYLNNETQIKTEVSTNNYEFNMLVGESLAYTVLSKIQDSKFPGHLFNFIENLDKVGYPKEVKRAFLWSVAEQVTAD